MIQTRKHKQSLLLRPLCLALLECWLPVTAALAQTPSFTTPQRDGDTIKVSINSNMTQNPGY